MKKGIAVFSGSNVIHKLMQDGVVVLGSNTAAADVTVSGNVNITGSLTASADSVLVGAVSPLTSSVLSDIIIELYNTGSGNTTALSQSVSSSVADLQFQIDTLSGDIDLSGTLTTIAEIQEFLDNDGSGTAGIIANFNDLSTGFEALSGSFVSASVTLNGIELNVQAQDSLDIVTGSTGNLSVTTGSNQIIIDLQDNVSLSGSLVVTGALSASGGLDVDNGATVDGGLTVLTGDLLVSAGDVTASGSAIFTGSLTVKDSATLEAGLTVSSGDVAVDGGNLTVSGTATVTGTVLVVGAADAEAVALTVQTGSLAVSHGTMQTLLVGGVDDTQISSLYAASGSSNGRFFYLQGSAPISTFPRANCWYFCQDGVWYDSPFFSE